MQEDDVPIDDVSLPDGEPEEGTQDGDASNASLLDGETEEGMEEDDASMNDAPLPDDEPEEELCPNMDTFIPGERLPEFLDVYDDTDFCETNAFYRSRTPAWKKFTQHRYPVKFVRVYPPRTPADKGAFYPV